LIASVIVLSIGFSLAETTPLCWVSINSFLFCRNGLSSNFSCSLP